MMDLHILYRYISLTKISLRCPCTRTDQVLPVMLTFVKSLAFWQDSTQIQIHREIDTRKVAFLVVVVQLAYFGS